MMERVRHERGAALIMILLFTALMFILVTTMLGSLGNEALVSGLHRDATRALEHAQAGLEEGVRRIEGGRQYGGQVPGSLAPGILIDVEEIVPGQGLAYLEVKSNATVGVARRRLSTIVLAESKSTLSKIIFGYSLASQGAAQITSGDVYSETYVDYKNLPTSSDTITYAAWAIRKRSPDPIPWCYGNMMPCPGQPKWRPGTRRAQYRDTRFRPVAKPGNTTLDTRSGATDLNWTCSPNPPGAYASQTVMVDGVAYGYQAGDRRADTNALVDPAMKLYGCDSDNGNPTHLRPYTWVREVIDNNGDGVIDAADDVNGDNQPEALWMKTVVFEDWFDDYWCPNLDPTVMTYEKCHGLEDANLMLGAVPPFPDFDELAGTYDQYQTGGGTVAAGSTLDFGCKEPEMNPCPGGVSTPQIVLLDNGDYRVNANLQGYGILLVDGNLEVNGTLEYWGVIIVRGQLTLGSGNVIVHGGLIAEDTAEITGSIIVEAGAAVANKIIGPAIVTQKIWWER